MLPKTEKEIDLFCMLLEINRITKLLKESDNSVGYLNSHYHAIFTKELKDLKEEYLKLVNEL